MHHLLLVRRAVHGGLFFISSGLGSCVPTAVTLDLIMASTALMDGVEVLLLRALVQKARSGVLAARTSLLGSLNVLH